MYFWEIAKKVIFSPQNFMGTASRINQVDIDTIQILDSSISFQKSIKYLGVRLDPTLTMRDYISDVCRSTYLSLRRIGSIRHLLTDKAAICLVNALIFAFGLLQFYPGWYQCWPSLSSAETSECCCKTRYKET